MIHRLSIIHTAGWRQLTGGTATTHNSLYEPLLICHLRGGTGFPQNVSARVTFEFYCYLTLLLCFTRPWASRSQCQIRFHTPVTGVFQSITWSPPGPQQYLIHLCSLVSTAWTCVTIWNSLKREGRKWSISHQLVLIGRDGGEDRLDEDEGAELLGLEVEQRGRVVLLLDDVDPRLVLVHGVQDDLQTTNTVSKHTRLRSASPPIILRESPRNTRSTV